METVNLIEMPAPPFGYSMEAMEHFAKDAISDTEQLFEKCKTDIQYRERKLKEFAAFSEWFALRQPPRKPELEYIKLNTRLQKKYGPKNPKANTAPSSVMPTLRIPKSIKPKLRYLNAVELRLVMLIADHMANDLFEGCYPSRELLAEAANTTCNRIRKATKHLVELKIIEFQEGKRIKGEARNEKNFYWWFGWRHNLTGTSSGVQFGGTFSGVQNVPCN